MHHGAGRIVVGCSGHFRGSVVILKAVSGILCQRKPVGVARTGERGTRLARDPSRRVFRGVSQGIVIRGRGRALDIGLAVPVHRVVAQRDRVGPPGLEDIASHCAKEVHPILPELGGRRGQNVIVVLLGDQGVAINNANLNTVYYAQPQTQYVAQPQVQYLASPVTTQVKYVPTYNTTQPPITYLPASVQGASAYNSVSTNKVKTNTGGYLNFDPNMQAASAYSCSGTQLIDGSYDPNGVTALSMNGSGSFLPSSVFQWFMLILLIFAIIIVARMIIKKRAANSANATPAH